MKRTMSLVLMVSLVCLASTAWADRGEAAAKCGNNVLNNGEACDFGPANTTNCDRDCTVPECGDGVWNSAAGEACDGTDPASPACTDCTLSTQEGVDTLRVGKLEVGSLHLAEPLTVQEEAQEHLFTTYFAVAYETIGGDGEPGRTAWPMFVEFRPGFMWRPADKYVGFDFNLGLGAHGAWADDAASHFTTAFNPNLFIGTEDGGVLLGPMVRVIGPLGEGDSFELAVGGKVAGVITMSNVVAKVSLGWYGYQPEGFWAPSYDGVMIGVELGYSFDALVKKGARTRYRFHD